MKVRKNIKISGIFDCRTFGSYILSLAKKFNLSGWVKSNKDSTNIEIEGDNDSVSEFMSTIYDEPESSSKISEVDFQDVPVANSIDFYIKKELFQSIRETSPHDAATCPECLEKLFNSQSRMYQYPFLSCQECGPAFSTIKSLPYTRENTSLDNLKFCDECNDDINKGILEANFCNCPKCGPKLWFKSKNDTISNQEESFKRAAKIIAQNGVLLLKSTNCFYFCSNARSDKAVDRIREIKVRKNKPLSLMAESIEEIKKFAYVNHIEEELLTSKERPVVFLQTKPNNYISSKITAGFDKIGVMLPFNPIQHLLFSNVKQKVLIMSSANKSGQAIETDNQRAENAFGNLVDGMLLHDLNILNGSDDSLVTVIKNEKYVLRLSRGYAPNNIIVKDVNTNSVPVVLACGAYQNSTIALSTPDRIIHTSPYMGSLETSNVFDLYKKNIVLFCKLFNVAPEYAVCDLNPDYLSTKYVMNLKIPYFQVQHNYAHLLSCLTDNELPLETPVIGVIFDGSGFGSDQTVWGGEFLVSKNMDYERANHIPVFKMIGFAGKESQVYRLGYSLLQNAGVDETHPVYKNLKMTSEEQKMFSSLMHKGVNSPLTSSAGKIFDAVASILGIMQTTPYEEYSTLYLESLADKTCRHTYNLKDYNIKNINELIMFIVKDVENKEPIPTILAKFHNTLARMVACTSFQISKKAKIRIVVLSGSIWMNTFLLSRTLDELEIHNLIPFIHKNISTNDEGLSVGQASYILYKLSKQKVFASKH